MRKTMEDLPQIIDRVHEAFRAPAEGAVLETPDEFPTIQRPSGLNDAIIKLLSTSWGKTKPRTWDEIDEGLKHNALHYGRGSVTGALTYLVKNNRLRRVKVNGTYGYLLPL